MGYKSFLQIRRRFSPSFTREPFSSAPPCNKSRESHFRGEPDRQLHNQTRCWQSWFCDFNTSSGWHGTSCSETRVNKVKQAWWTVSLLCKNFRVCIWYCFTNWFDGFSVVSSSKVYQYSNIVSIFWIILYFYRTFWDGRLVFEDFFMPLPSQSQQVWMMITLSIFVSSNMCCFTHRLQLKIAARQ